jgi:hypothetical protein
MKKTGETCTQPGIYDWVMYTDGSKTPSPTNNERAIRLTHGETFPPVRSCNKGAWWSFARP